MHWIAVLSFMGILSSCEPVLSRLGKEPDGPAEEFVEEVVRLNTGVQVDLTPMTPEKR